jgi:hypothetical protein
MSAKPTAWVGLKVVEAWQVRGRDGGGGAAAVQVDDLGR